MANPEKKFIDDLTLIYEKFGYQKNIFRRFTKPKELPSHAVIFNLNAGECVDVVAMREVYGPDAMIYSFDIEQPKQSFAQSALRLGNGFLQMDIQDIQGCMDAVGMQPHLVVSRAPRVIEKVFGGTGQVTLNTWWGDTLAQWAEVLQPNGQMLVTTYTELERDFIAAAFARHGMRGERLANSYFNQPRHYQFDVPLWCEIPEGMEFSSATIGKTSLPSRVDGYTYFTKR